MRGLPLGLAAAMMAADAGLTVPEPEARDFLAPRRVKAHKPKAKSVDRRRNANKAARKARAKARRS